MHRQIKLVGTQVVHAHAAHVEVGLHERAGIEVERAAAAHDHDTPARRCHFRILHEVGLRRHVDHDIDAAALGSRENLIQVTLGVVVEGTPGAEALHELPASDVAGRAIHDGPDAMRKLHREGSHPAARTVDEHRFAGTHPRTHEQRVGRSQPGSAEARALLERNSVGERGHGGGVADDELGIGAGAAAGACRRHEHALPHVRSCARFRHRTAPSAFVKTSLPFAARS